MTRNVTKRVTGATRRTVVVGGVWMDIGESIVTRNVTKPQFCYVTIATRRTVVVVRSVMMDIGESIVGRNVTKLVTSVIRRTVVV